MLKDVEKPAVFLHFQLNLILIVEKSPLNTHIFKSKLLTPFNIKFSTITQQFVENLTLNKFKHSSNYNQIYKSAHITLPNILQFYKQHV